MAKRIKEPRRALDEGRKVKDRCENCRCWRPEQFALEEIKETGFGVGLCVRFPPTISSQEGLEYGLEDGVLGKEAFFPVTAHNAYCYEHKPKGKKDGDK